MFGAENSASGFQISDEKILGLRVLALVVIDVPQVVLGQQSVGMFRTQNTAHHLDVLCQEPFRFDLLTLKSRCVSNSGHGLKRLQILGAKDSALQVECTLLLLARLGVE